MKRFLSILLALALALTLGIPALAAEHRAGDTYIRILGSSGARTVGVRTTYGAYRQTADGAVYRDDRYEFVYTDDGVSWVSAGAELSGAGVAAVPPPQAHRERVRDRASSRARGFFIIPNSFRFPMGYPWRQS